MNLYEYEQSLELVDYPLECHQKTTPNFESYRITSDDSLIYTMLSCPNPECNVSYVAEYQAYSKNDYLFYRLITGQQKAALKEEFPEVESISTMFSKIYNEAYVAEQHGLLEICGVGYRKALEFLI